MAAPSLSSVVVMRRREEYACGKRQRLLAIVAAVGTHAYKDWHFLAPVVPPERKKERDLVV